MSSDHDAQKDEMLALESIFDSDEFSKANDDGEFSGQFYAFVSIPGEVKIEYKFVPLHSRKKKKKLIDDDLADLNQISVKFLPPLELSFTLPPDYPSTSPPRYTLISCWLDRKQLSKLCEKLDSLWNENQGLEILYLWMSFLKEESYNFLGLGTTINLSKLYSFNLRHLEKLKKFQTNEKNVADSSDDKKMCGSAVVSTVSSLTIDKPNPKEVSAKTEASTNLRSGNPFRGRGRGRGRGRNAQKNCSKPGASNKDTSLSTETASVSGVAQNRGGVYSNGDSLTENLYKVGIAYEGRNAMKPSLKNRGKSHLGAIARIVKNEASASCVLDQRAVSCDSLQTPLISYILDYNKSLSEKEFQRNIYSCRICFDDKPGTQCIEFLGCGHVFCRECVSSYFEVTIKDGNVHALTCPEEGCISEALQSQIYGLVSSELFSRYDELLLSSTLDEMDDIVYCPRKTCQYPVTRDADEKMARCAHCSYTFCILCRMGYHGVDPCRIKIDSGLVAEYEAASDEKKLMLEKKYGRRQLQDFLESGYSEQWIKGNSKSCPHCHAAIEKSEGCNKMICWKCNTFFCWICNTRLDPSHPYRHFNNPGSGCFEMLFHGLPDESDESDPEIDSDGSDEF